MEKPKFRLFAGPNGSGKTYLFKKFRSEGLIHTEFYINADRFEADMKKNRKFSFNAYRVKVSDITFKKHIQSSGLFQKMKEHKFLELLFIRSGILYIPNSVKINSYHASFVASYLAERLLASKQSFAYETVMSHKSKVKIMRLARKSGYKTYLYFVFVDDPQTNVARVKLRALKGEHDVEANTITDRIPRTISLLPSAFQIADSAYVIDNSNEATILIKKEQNKLDMAAQIPTILQKATNQIKQQFTGKSRK
jgi:predicted ABC-type ATPase